MVAPIADPIEVVQAALGQALVQALPTGSSKRRILAYAAPGRRIVVHDGYRVYHVRSAYQRLNERLLETLENPQGEGRLGLVVDPETGEATVLPMDEGYAMICSQAMAG